MWGHYKARIYVKFMEENNWKAFIDKVEKDFSLPDYQENFIEWSAIDQGQKGIRIRRKDLDCLIYDTYDGDVTAHTLSGSCSGYVRSVGNKGIVLADCFSDDANLVIGYDYYYVGEDYTKMRLREDAAEHFEIDIADYEKWLGEDRINELTDDQKELLSQLGGSESNQVSEEEAVLLRKIHNRCRQKNLIEIFPNINKNADNKLVIEDGVLTDWNDTQEEFLGIDDTVVLEDGSWIENNSWFLPAEVREIDSDIDMFASDEGSVTLVFTTNLKKLDPSVFRCRGFEHVYIIDAETEDVLFHSEKFWLDDPDALLADDELWNEFARSYNEWPAVAMANPWFFNPRWNHNPRPDMASAADAGYSDEVENRVMEWKEYVKRFVNLPQIAGVKNDSVSEETAAPIEEVLNQDIISHDEDSEEQVQDQEVLIYSESTEEMELHQESTPLTEQMNDAVCDAGEDRVEDASEEIELVHVYPEASTVYVLDVDMAALFEKNIDLEELVLPEDLLEKFRNLDITLSSEEIIRYFGFDIEPETWSIDEPVKIEEDRIEIHCKSYYLPDPELWEEICKSYDYVRLNMFSICEDPKYYYTEGFFEGAVMLFYPDDDHDTDDYDFYRDAGYCQYFGHFWDAMEFAANKKHWVIVKPTEPYLWRILSEEEFKRERVYSIQELRDLGWKV